VWLICSLLLAVNPLLPLPLKNLPLKNLPLKKKQQSIQLA
jgi:hypothetical protein